MQLQDPRDFTSQFHPADIQQNKGMAILAYFGILVLVPIFAAKNSPFARFHANQGLILFIAEVAWSIASYIASTILITISYHLAWISGILSLVNIVFLVLAIIGIVNAAQGKAKELPIIGQFQILK